MGVVTMGARELHAGRLVGLLVFSLVLSCDAAIEAGSDDIKEDIISQSDVLRDISELRREVEQLRSEVRQKDEKAVRDNTEVIVDWLKETVGDLRDEVRNLEIKEEGRQDGVKEEEIERVRRELGDMKEDILKLRVKEETSISTMEEMEQRLDHVAKSEDIALRRINNINQSDKRNEGHGKKHSFKKHLKYKQHKHKNLSKKHLQMWMRETDSFHQELINTLEVNKNKLEKLENNQKDMKKDNCARIQHKVAALEKTLDDNREIEDTREEGEKIILNSMTRKIDQLEQKLENFQHQQVLIARKIEKLANDLNAAVKNGSL